MAFTATENSYYKHTLTAGGGTISLDVDAPLYLHTLTGTATLAASWAVQETGTVRLGQRFIIKYEAVIDLNGNNITIFGVTIPEGMSDQPFYVDAIYNGTSWDTHILPSFDGVGFVETTHIADDAVTADKLSASAGTDADRAVTTDHIRNSAVTTAKIADEDVTLAKLDPTLIVETFVVPVSFEANEKCNNSIFPDFDGEINAITYVVTKAIAGTDDATISPEINANPTTPGTITIAASTALDNSATVNIVSGNSFSAGDEISFVSAKTTSGGKALLSIKVTRT